MITKAEETETLLTLGEEAPDIVGGEQPTGKRSGPEWERATWIRDCAPPGQDASRGGGPWGGTVLSLGHLWASHSTLHRPLRFQSWPGAVTWRLHAALPLAAPVKSLQASGDDLTIC